MFNNNSFSIFTESLKLTSARHSHNNRSDRDGLLSVSSYNSDRLGKKSTQLHVHRIIFTISLMYMFFKVRYQKPFIYYYRNSSCLLKIVKQNWNCVLNSLYKKTSLHLNKYIKNLNLLEHSTYIWSITSKPFLSCFSSYHCYSILLLLILLIISY